MYGWLTYRTVHAMYYGTAIQQHPRFPCCHAVKGYPSRYLTNSMYVGRNDRFQPLTPWTIENFLGIVARSVYRILIAASLLKRGQLFWKTSRSPFKTSWAACSIFGFGRPAFETRTCPLSDLGLMNLVKNFGMESIGHLRCGYYILVHLPSGLPPAIRSCKSPSFVACHARHVRWRNKHVCWRGANIC